MGLQEDFEAASKAASDKSNPWNLKTADNTQKLELYGLYKQATVGDNTTDKPGMFSGFEAGYKWDAWNKKKGTSKDQAMQEYIKLVESLKQ
eukprot:CAMPEP_0113678186 /NCGR_PEP_ID=MMETSP0038_2-20120614/9771_1 /TAXON_ID=2898 /ORGANISM="Cryptomonas paramecium" /LENGTH=90 /DNA_ID=CAMNT_0000595723 /DNA_START=46 /DNA_END=318 /DNA_ORIENTATION=+ /assembly_acc=CAM_ASM_000170